VTARLPAIVATEWLAAKLGTPGIRVVDGSWYLPGSGRNAATEYAAGHIPGAVFFDIDASSDPSTPLPHMLPTAERFAERMASLGLSDSDHIVVYDGSGVNLSAPRVWWTFRTFGHDRVSVLDGGTAKWRREHRPIEQGVVTLPPGRFTARLDRAAVRDLASVRANIHQPVEQLVDTRSAGRFAGVEPEPRPGLRGGHVPGSVNLPFTDLVRADGTILPPEELRRRLAEAGIDLARPVVATCGSGTSACALVLSLYLVGHSQTAVYDGAWAEWGARADTPVEVQPIPKGD
jgi:thiosulfate/3-mercaptopyruvate sulfurtransferase